MTSKKLNRLEIDVLRKQLLNAKQISYTFKKYELSTENLDILIGDLIDEISRIIAKELIR